MDFLESHHLTPAEMGTSPGLVADLRWYPCAPGALAFPEPHAFLNPVWEDTPERWRSGPGCYPFTEWRQKAYPAPPGQHFHGPLEYFQTGIPPDAVPPDVLPADCGFGSAPLEGLAIADGQILLIVHPGPSLIYGAGGSAEGGAAEFTPGENAPPWGACSFLPEGRTTATLRLSMTGWPSPYEGFNGTHVMSQVAPCRWLWGASFHDSFQLDWYPEAAEWTVLWVGGDTNSAGWSSSTYDASVPTVFTLGGEVGGPVAPMTVTVTAVH